MFAMYDIYGFGNRLKTVRKARKFSQQRLADEMYIKRGTVNAWENGVNVDGLEDGNRDKKSRIPEVDNMIRICEVLNCDLDYLLGRCDTWKRETAEISEATGLSPAAAETLIKWKSFSAGELDPKTFDEVTQAKFGQNTLNSLLESDEGIDVLRKIGLYLHGKISRILPRGERETIEHDHLSPLLNTDASEEEIRAEFQAVVDELDLAKKTVTFEIEDLDMLWAMDTEYVKSMILSWIQEALTNLKKKTDTAKGKEGGVEDGNGEKAR